MSILVFVEHDGSGLDKAALGVLSRAASLGAGEVSAVICGSGPLDALGVETGRFGAARVYLASDEALDAPLPQPRVDVLADLVRSGGHDTVLFSNSVLASDVAAGLACRLGAGVNWDLTAIEWRDGSPVGIRPALQDSVLVEVGWRSPVRIGLFRPGSFDAASGASGEVVMEKVATRFEEYSRAVRIVSRQVVPETEGPSLDDAEVVVAGGMGLGGPEHFSLAEQLAEALGGVVGATRAAVYAGWYPRSAQIGQTGKKVTPKLYVGLGVSGAVQHRVGMQAAKTIIAVNKDPAAPILEVSDLAVVADVHTVVPRLVELIKKRKGP